MTIDVETVCTDAELADECGGPVELARLIPKGTANASTQRAAALRDTLKSLRLRRPPINEGDLSDVTELRDAVTFGALERLYLLAMTTKDSVFGVKHEKYQKRFAAELASLSPTVGGSASGGGGSITIERR